MSKLKKVLNNKHMSQEELSRLSGINLSTIRAWSQGINKLDNTKVHSLFKVANILQCTIEELVENEETIKLILEYNETNYVQKDT